MFFRVHPWLYTFPNMNPLLDFGFDMTCKQVSLCRNPTNFKPYP